MPQLPPFPSYYFFKFAFYLLQNIIFNITLNLFFLSLIKYYFKVYFLRKIF